MVRGRRPSPKMLTLLAGPVVLDETCAVLPAVIFAIQALAITLLRQWHGEAREAETTSGFA